MSGREQRELLPRRFGEFGGRFVPEALDGPLEQVARAAREAFGDPSFVESLERWVRQRCARPTAVTHLRRLSETTGGAQVWAKREDLGAGGSFAGLSATVQAVLAQRMGARRIIGDTATGDFGVALGSVGAALGLDVTVYMARDDRDKEPTKVARMEAFGVDVQAVGSAGQGGRRIAIAEALREYSRNPKHYFWATSSLASPAPYPALLQESLRRIGEECRDQLAAERVEPEYVVAPVGSGSFAAGLFTAFVEAGGCQLVGVQAGGGSSLVEGRPGVYLGTRSMVLQTKEGQIDHGSVGAAGLAMPVAGPQLARWLQRGTVHFVSVSDEDAQAARRALLKQEGIAASLEASFAVAYAVRVAATLSGDEAVLVGITGGGAKP